MEIVDWGSLDFGAYGVFLSKISCLRPASLGEVIDEAFSIFHIMDDIAKSSFRAIVRNRN